MKSWADHFMMKFFCRLLADDSELKISCWQPMPNNHPIGIDGQKLQELLNLTF